MPYSETVWRAFEIASIAYGRADFGIADGRVQIYEINTNPSVKPGENHPSPVRTANLSFAWNAHVDALRALDSKHAGGDFVELDDERLAPHQRRRLIPDRTRRAP
jgi:hypothetical protein